jgi:hypothetical protein
MRSTLAELARDEEGHAPPNLAAPRQASFANARALERAAPGYDRRMEKGSLSSRMERRGTVYIGDSSGLPPRYDGYWEAGDYFNPDDGPHGVLEYGDEWDDANAAVEWGRSRATVVIVRIGDVHYSAGEVLALDEADEPLPAWPPPADIAKRS